MRQIEYWYFYLSSRIRTREKPWHMQVSNRKAKFSSCFLDQHKRIQFILMQWCHSLNLHKGISELSFYMLTIILFLSTSSYQVHNFLFSYLLFYLFLCLCLFYLICHLQSFSSFSIFILDLLIFCIFIPHLHSILDLYCNLERVDLLFYLGSTSASFLTSILLRIHRHSLLIEALFWFLLSK